VVRTRVGYAGGTTKNPTYRGLGDHTETVEIDFDPSRISYSRLLDVFWQSHDPAARPWSRQYRSGIFFHSKEQQRLALESRDREAARRGKIYTEILPYTGFTLAEDYHQKYRLQQESDLMIELQSIYPSMRDFINSTAVARINGFLGGSGAPDDLKREIDSYGLSASGRKRLIEILSSSKEAFRSCPLR
jgi:peptide-methionine (S)-S-oxide reductase